MNILGRLFKSLIRVVIYFSKENTVPNEMKIVKAALKKKKLMICFPCLS